jgi:UDP-glucose 6-dehydrogenase
MSREREPIGVIGTGYVGLVTAVGFAELGSDVWCVDIDEDKIERLRRGEVPIYEPGLPELLAKNRERLHFTTELAPALEHARLLFVAVGTPPTYSGDADLSAVNAVVQSMPPSDRHALVMKSTVPCGTGATIKRIFREQGKDGFRYVSCPEFLKEGSAVKDFLQPDRVVIGDEGDWAGDAVAELYEPLAAPIVRTDIFSSEMVKLASNAFLATKISFINEIANVCEETGADVLEVARGMGLDDRIGPKFLQAGIGFGGSCLAGEETVVIRDDDGVALKRMDELFYELEDGSGRRSGGATLLRPDDLEVLAWSEDRGALFRPVASMTRRPFDGLAVEVRTRAGHSVLTTPDHPFVVRAGAGTTIARADQLRPADMLPAVDLLGAAEPVLMGSAVDDDEHQSEACELIADGHPLATSWVGVSEVLRLPLTGPVYSLEVPGEHTFVTTGGLVTHNCFPKDVAALKQLAGNSGYHFQLLNSVIEVNELQKRRVIGKLQKHLGSLVGKEIALLGLAFKPNTDDMREASSLVLAARLQADGARIRAFDPVAEEEARKLIRGVDFAPSAAQALDGADAVVLVTEWPEFADIDWADAHERMRGTIVIDGRNFLDAGRLAELGFTYEGVGRPVAGPVAEAAAL